MGDLGDKLADDRLPDILGPPECKDPYAECDFCGLEPAEHRVRLWSWEPLEPPDSWDFDLCGTCLAREQKEAKNRRFDDDESDPD